MGRAPPAAARIGSDSTTGAAAGTTFVVSAAPVMASVYSSACTVGHLEARKRVIEAAGLSEVREHTQAAPTPHVLAAEAIATPTDRVRQLRRELCAVVDCEDAVQYLASRGLWPLPAGCTLSAHASLKYFEDGRCLGRYPAIVADVVDVAGEFVTAHVTYLEGGKKLAKLDADGTLLSPRKKLSGLRGRTGCAARRCRPARYSRSPRASKPRCQPRFSTSYRPGPRWTRARLRSSTAS